MKKINSIGFMVSEVNYLFVMNSVSIAFFSKVVDNKQKMVTCGFNKYVGQWWL